MLFRPAGVWLAGFMAKVYDASILIDLGAPNSADEPPRRINITNRIEHFRLCNKGSRRSRVQQYDTRRI